MLLKTYLRCYMVARCLLMTFACTVVITGTVFLLLLILEEIGIWGQGNGYRDTFYTIERTEAEKESTRIASLTKFYHQSGKIHLGKIDKIKKDRNGKLNGNKVSRSVVIYDSNLKELKSTQHHFERENDMYRKGVHEERLGEYLYFGMEWYGLRWHGGLDVRKEGEFCIDTSRTRIIPVVRGGNTIAERWRYDPKKYIYAGYDNKGLSIGFLGCNGFVSNVKQAKPFDPLYQRRFRRRLFNVCVKITSHHIYEIDFANRTLKTIFTSPDEKIQKVLHTEWFATKDSSTKVPSAMSIYTEDKAYYLLRKGYKVIEIPAIKASERLLGFGRIDNTLYIATISVDVNMPIFSDEPKAFRTWRWTHREEPRVTAICLYRLDEDGKMVLSDAQTFTAYPEKIYGGNDANTYRYNRWQDAWITPWHDIAKYSSSLNPIIYKGLWLYPQLKDITAFITSRPKLYSFIRELGIMEIVSFSLDCSFISVIIISIICMAIMFPHYRKRNMIDYHYYLWAFYILLFNLPGLITYYAVSHTPLTICGHCKQSRSLQLVKCHRCVQSLPRPEKKTTDLVSKGVTCYPLKG